jgi:hypothetical protein
MENTKIDANLNNSNCIQMKNDIGSTTYVNICDNTSPTVTDTEKQKIREEWEKKLYTKDGNTQTLWLPNADDIADYWLSIIDKTIKSKLEAVEGALDRHCNWTPTEGYGSEEEKGYQKGLIAEAKLLRSEILEIINKHK